LGLKKESVPSLVKTVATEGKGTELLIREIDEFIESRDEEFHARRKKRLISWMLRDIINEKIYHVVTQNVKASEIGDFVEKIYQREVDPYTVADEIIKKLKRV